jgi:hypothetical protein
MFSFYCDAEKRMARDGPGEAECVGKGTGEEVVEDCNKVSSEFPILQQSEVPIQLASFPHLELGATVYVFEYFFRANQGSGAVVQRRRTASKETQGGTRSRGSHRGAKGEEARAMWRGPLPASSESSKGKKLSLNNKI